MASSSTAKMVCSLCPAERTEHLSLNLTSFLKHVKLFHAHQPGFKITCGISDCQRSYTNFRTLQDHVSALQRYQLNPSNIVPSSCTELDDDISSEDERNDSSEPTCVQSHSSVRDLMQKSAALFIMGLKEKHKLSQAAVQSIISGATSLHQLQLDMVLEQVKLKLTEAGVAVSSVPGLGGIFREDGENGLPSSGLETQHQQLKYYSTNFGLIVRPTVNYRCCR